MARVRWPPYGHEPTPGSATSALPSASPPAALDAAEAIDMWGDQAIALRAGAEVHDRAGRRAEAPPTWSVPSSCAHGKATRSSRDGLRTWLTELGGPRACPTRRGARDRLHKGRARR